MSIAQDLHSQVDPAQVCKDPSELLMLGTLGEVQRLRGIAQEGGMLVLEATLGLPIIAGIDAPQDRVTQVTISALTFASRTAAESLGQTGHLDERTLGQVRRVRHPVVTNAVGSAAIMGRTRLVMPGVFRREHDGKKIAPEKHVDIARNSYALVRRLASRNFMAFEAVLRYLTPGPLAEWSRFDPSKFKLTETEDGEGLTIANRAELAEVVRKERERLKDSPVAPKPGRHCPALDVSDGTESLVAASWGLMTDIQEAQFALRPGDRLKSLGSSVMQRAGFSLTRRR